MLRLGCAYGPAEAITHRVLSAARRGWRLIDGDPGAWLALIAEDDATQAVLPAIAVPPGVYHLTDGAPITQGLLMPAWRLTLGKTLHSLDDPGWGRDGFLFGLSRRITDTTFSDLTGWHPQVALNAEILTDLLLGRPPGRRPDSAGRWAGPFRGSQRGHRAWPIGHGRSLITSANRATAAAPVPLRLPAAIRISTSGGMDDKGS